mmetsp:Transcript_28552/g.48492  ORF Transcript_28552/g.48492 Transcript_28552/m.48492 type:complete len:187 (-) Transcript_28552:407-967(-)
MCILEIIGLILVYIYSYSRLRRFVDFTLFNRDSDGQKAHQYLRNATKALSVSASRVVGGNDGQWFQSEQDRGILAIPKGVRRIIGEAMLGSCASSSTSSASTKEGGKGGGGGGDTKRNDDGRGSSSSIKAKGDTKSRSSSSSSSSPCPIIILIRHITRSKKLAESTNIMLSVAAKDDEDGDDITSD